MALHAVLAAIEEYQDRAIAPVRYAAADALGFAEVLTGLGCRPDRQTLLLNENATRAVLERDVRDVLGRLTPDDVLFVALTGHGFVVDGKSYFAGYDARPHELADSSLSLPWLFEELGGSRCGRVCVFLDASHRGLLKAPLPRRLRLGLDVDVLNRLITGFHNVAVFCACQSDQISHFSPHLSRRVWAHHLQLALRGEAPLALADARTVTAASLQNYLSQAVPRMLRADSPTPIQQTPWLGGAVSDEFVVADLQPLLQQRESQQSSPSTPLHRVMLSSNSRRSIKTLSGFKKTHRIPDRKNSTAQEFVTQISEPELQAELVQTFQNLRTTYRFKRLELDLRGPADGSGVIITPSFEYSVALELSADDPSEVIWRRVISKISDPARIFCEEFEAVFADTFDTVELSTVEPVDVAAVIDRIEELDSPQITVSYDPDCTMCTVQLAGSQAEFVVTRHGVSIQDRRASSSRKLLESALSVLTRLKQDFGINALPSSYRR